MAGLMDLLDLAGLIRYGVPTSTKEALAVGAALPGAPQDRTADQDIANRYAAGYLFGNARGDLAQSVLPAVTYFKMLGIPGFSSTPEEQSYAHEGLNRALLDKANAERAGQGLTLADILGSLGR